MPHLPQQPFDMPKQKKTTDDGAETQAPEDKQEPVVARKRVIRGTGGPLAARAANKKNFDAAAAMRKDLLSKLGVGTGLTQAAKVDRDCIPYQWMALQYLTGNIGLPVQTVSEIIGSDRMGKSSLLMAMLASFTKSGCYCLYISTEAKTLKKKWIRQRLCGHDKALAEEIADTIDVEEGLTTFGEVDKYMRNWAHIKRNVEGCPLSEPLVIVVDSISALLTDEAGKAIIDKDAKDAGVQKGVDDVKEKMCGAAYWLHRWVRFLKQWMQDNNATVICVSSQNQDLSLFKSADKNNRTKLGGEALNQKSALQITLSKAPVKQASLVEGTKNILIKCLKNSYGAEGRELIYTLKQEAYKYADTETFTEQAIDMSTTLCNILLENGLFGITSNRKRYSSDELGLYQVSAEEFEERVNGDEALQHKIGVALGIDGYTE